MVEFDKARDLAWINITGVTQRGRFRLREAGPGRTIVTFRLAYHSDGGLLGVIADRIAAGQVGRPLSQSLKNLQRLVDSWTRAATARETSWSVSGLPGSGRWLDRALHELHLADLHRLRVEPAARVVPKRQLPASSARPGRWSLSCGAPR